MTFPVHSGRRKRGPRAAEIDAMQKRRAGSKAEREAAARLYEPHPLAPSSSCPGQCWYPEQCAMAGKCSARQSKP